MGSLKAGKMEELQSELQEIRSKYLDASTAQEGSQADNHKLRNDIEDLKRDILTLEAQKENQRQDAELKREEHNTDLSLLNEEIESKNLYIMELKQDMTEH